MARRPTTRSAERSIPIPTRAPPPPPPPRAAAPPPGGERVRGEPARRLIQPPVAPGLPLCDHRQSIRPRPRTVGEDLVDARVPRVGAPRVVPLVEKLAVLARQQERQVPDRQVRLHERSRKEPHEAA